MFALVGVVAEEAFGDCERAMDDVGRIRVVGFRMTCQAQIREFSYKFDFGRGYLLFSSLAVTELAFSIRAVRWFF